LNLKKYFNFTTIFETMLQYSNFKGVVSDRIPMDSAARDERPASEMFRGHQENAA
jgi:hypothetical protein